MPADAEGQQMLSTLIDLAPMLAAQAEAIMVPLAQNRLELRTRLLDDGVIVSVPEPTGDGPESLCAIDGGRITEKLAGADLLAAVATTSSGQSTQGRAPVDDVDAVWTELMSHGPELDKVVGTAMACLEAFVGAAATHEVRLVDGSFQTGIIEPRNGLASNVTVVRNRVTELLNEYDHAANIAALLAYNPDRVVIALPKSETSTVLRNQFSTAYDIDIPVIDRVLAGYLLHPGEMFMPRPLTEWAGQYVQPHSDANRATRDAAAALNEAIKPFRDAAAAGTAVTTYYKSHQKNLATRLEYRTAEGADPVTTAFAMAGLIEREMSTFAVEPIAQWAVDRKAKTISSGVKYLRSSLADNLAPEQSSDWGRFITDDYRTTA